jgi:predicted DNA-binding transcriptional regulator AlpA
MERISVTILGSFETLADLTAAHPTGNTGDCYLVGDDIYVWSPTGNNWGNIGNLKDLKVYTGESRVARFISLTEVVRRVRKHACTLRRWWQHDPPLFPRPRRTGPNSIAFVDIEVDDWILTRPEVGNEGGEFRGRSASRATTIVIANKRDEWRAGPCVRPA